MKKIMLLLLSALGLSAFADAGFYQALYTGSSATAGDPFTDGVVVGEMGLAKAGNSYVVGETTYKMGDNTTAAYKAYWKMTAGVKYSFVKNFDDWGYVYITSPSGVGTEVLKDGNWGNIVYKTYTPTETGFHLIDVRVGQGSGGIGPNKAPFNSTLSGMIWSDDASITGWNEAQADLYHCFANEDPANPVFLTSKMDATATLAYVPETKTATISVTVKALTRDTAGLKLVTKNPDKTVVTNVLAAAATVSETPYVQNVAVAEGSSEFAVLLDCGEDGVAEYTLPGVYAGEVTIAAGENGDINFGKVGTFVVSRGETAADTAYPLTVNYAVTGGTAIAGTDFEISSGTVTIQAGASTATITIAPVYNKESTDAATLTLGLADGNYTIGAASSAEISFAKANGCWTYDATAKTIADGTWVFSVTESSGRLKLAGLGSDFTVPEDVTALNLVKPILDANGTAYTIYEIAANLLQNKCTTLTTLLLPDTLTTIGNFAFQGCPIEGDLTLGYGTAGNLSIGNWAFASHHLTNVRLGPRMKTLGSGAFDQGSVTPRTLLDVEIPDTLTKWDAYPFNGCSVLTNITHCLPRGLTGITHSMVSGLSSLGGTFMFCCGDSAYNAGQGTAAGTAFHTIRFGKKFTGIFTSNNSFSGMTNLRHIYMEGDALFDFQGTYAFQSHTAYGVLLHVPETSENWQGVLADTTQVKPWSMVDADAKAKFAEYFPNERKPKGLILATWTSTGKNAASDSLQNCWLTDDSSSAGSIVVTGDPDNLGAPSLGYGTTKYAETEATACTMDEYVAVGPTLYRTTGYTASYLDESGEVVRTAEDTTRVFDLGAKTESVSLVWHLVPVAYRADVHMAAAEDRTVTESTTPSLNGYYKAGETITLTISGEGFVRWYGDVPEGQETSRTISVTAKAGLTLIPYFEGAMWKLSSDLKTMSNGYWTVNVTVSGTSVTVVTSEPSPCGILDFTTEIEGGYSLVKVGDNAFKNVSTLTSLRLPETVNTIGSNAFEGCPLTGDLVLGYGTGGTLTIGNWAFSKHQLTNVRLGPRIKALNPGVFNQNDVTRTLLDVELPETLTSWNEYPFQGCTSVTNVSPCIPRNVTQVRHTALSGLANARGTLEFACGDAAYGMGQNTAGGTGFDAIRFGKNFTGKFDSNNSCSGMKNLKHIYTESDNVFDFRGTYAFQGRKEYGIVLHLPELKENPNWKAVTEDPEQVTPWAQVPAEAKAKFRENFPGEARPGGLIVSKWSSTDKNASSDSLKNCWITWPRKPAFSVLVR